MSMNSFPCKLQEKITSLDLAVFLGFIGEGDAFKTYMECL